MESGFRLALRRAICALPALALAVALTGAARIPEAGEPVSYPLGAPPCVAPIFDDDSPLAEAPGAEEAPDAKEASLAAEERASSAEELGYVPGEIVVVYEKDATDSEREEAVATLGAEEQVGTGASQDSEVAALTISDDMTVETAVQEARESAAVKYAIPNYVAELADEWTADPSAFISSSKSLVEQNGDQWHLSFLGTSRAWTLLEGNAKSSGPVKVAVIDTGASLNHPDLANVVNRAQSVEIVWTDSKEAASWKTRPLRGDGYTNGSSAPTEFTSHGTHVSGIIAAEAGNGGVLGVASGGSTSRANGLVDLVVIDAFSILNDNGQPNALLLDVVKAMEYAQQVGCRVVNMSLGFATNDPELADFFDEFCLELTEESDMLIVCAAGNDHRQSPKNYPAACPSTVSVISLSDLSEVERNSLTLLNPPWSGSNVVRSYFSNYGTWCDLSAPGENILSTCVQNGSTNGYAFKSGTSMACPMVSAAAALVRAANPDLTAEEVKALLCATTTDLYTSGRDVQTGWGALNAEAAVKEALGQRDALESVQGSASLASAEVTVSTATYTGKALEPKVAVKLNGRALQEGRDYKVSCPASPLIEAGRYTVVIHGQGDYKDVKKAQFNILKARMSAAKVAISPQTYTGRALEPVPEVTWSGRALMQGEDYSVYYQNNTAVGTGKATLVGQGNFSGQISTTFAIKRAPAPAAKPSTPAPSASSVAPKSTSTGSAAAPSPTASLPKTTKASAPAVKKVSAPKLKAGKRAFTVGWKKVSGNVSGYQVQYALDKKFKKSPKTKTLAKSKKSWSATKLKAKKRYYVRVRAYYKLDGKKYYGKWSTVKSVKTKR